MLALSAGPAAASGSELLEPVPETVVVTANGLEWVWASPCAVNGCTDGILVGKDGFQFATAAQWALRPSPDAFRFDKCAAPWFDQSHDHCDWWDPDYEGGVLNGYGMFGSAPTGGLPAGPDGTYPMLDAGDTWLVRSAAVTDADQDGHADDADNCPNTPNADQVDTDSDGEGDSCDADDDGDGVQDGSDGCPTTPAGTPDGCPYEFTGFFRPIDNLPAVNSAKAGSSIPVKFSLGGDEGLDVFAAGSPSSKSVDCSSDSSANPVGESSMTGGSLSYDAASQEYTYVWKTEKAWGSSCRELTVTLLDGSAHSALFSFTK